MALTLPAFPGYVRLTAPGDMPTPVWYQFFQLLYDRLGGAGGNPSVLLDNITDIAGSLLYRGSSLWQGLAPGAQFTLLRSGGTFPQWALIDGNSFPDVLQGLVFAGPEASDGKPVFRALVASDLPPISPSYGPQQPHAFLGGPAGASPAVPTFRVLVSSDIPLLSAANFATVAKNLVLAGPASGADATPTFRNAVGADFGVQNKNKFLGGPSTGADANPTFRVFATADLASVAGQFPGTTTNDDATAGNVGQYGASVAPNTSHTVTISNATPGVITWATHGLNVGSPVNFTTTGALPTGLSVGTNYYVCSTSLTANSFTVSTTLANAFAGTAVNTSSAGSGTHTAHSNVVLTTTAAVDITALSLTAGDWDVWANLATDAAITTSNGWISLTSATDPSAPNSGAYASWGAQTLATPIGQRRVSLASTTTVYLSMLPTFAGSVNGLGFLGARRAR